MITLNEVSKLLTDCRLSIMIKNSNTYVNKQRIMNYESWKIIHDKYCPMLYGVALEICPVKKEAEQLLISSFKHIYTQEIIPEKYPAYCLSLMRLVIKTAKELYPLKFKNNFRLKQFENTPLLNQFICEEIGFQDYCKEKYITQHEGLQLIRKELNLLRTF